MSLLAEYHLYIMIAVFIAGLFLPAEHRKKKLYLTAMAVLAFSIGYEVIAKEPVTKMPGTVNRMLNQKQEKNENKHYYKSPPSGL
jgi:hypothetical protein